VIGETENLHERRKRYKFGVQNGTPPSDYGDGGGDDDLEAERKTTAENSGAQHHIAK